MKREDFKKIIKLRSIWKVDKRKGNYRLPSGEKLSDYLFRLVDEQMSLDSLWIAKDGNLYDGEFSKVKKEYIIFLRENESCSLEGMVNRMDALVLEMLGY